MRFLRRTPDTIHMIASLGGHLELLIAAAPTESGREIVWVTSEGVRADELRNAGSTVHELPRLDRGSVSLRSILAGAILALRERPGAVVTAGAGLTVPFCLVSRLLGARLIVVETMARVERGSRSGRLLSKFADQVIVQWPELIDASYPDAILCEPLLLEGIGEQTAGGGDGTFVTVGSHDAPFDRLIAMVENAAHDGILPRPVFVQHGVRREAGRGLDGSPWLEPAEFTDRLRSAALVITHGGAGAIGTALRMGRTPIVVPRSSALGEHVDDHQDDLVSKLTEMGLIVCVRGGDLTREHVLDASRSPVKPVGDDLPTVGAALSRVLDQ